MKIVRTAPAALAAALVLAGCGSGGGDQNADGTTTVRVAVIPTVTKAPMYLGIEEGFFADEGLRVEPTVVQDGAAVTAAVSSGSAEFASSALVPVVTAATKGVPVKIVTTAASTSDPGAADAPYGDAVIAVRDDSDVTSLTDLEGKTVAVNALRAGVELVVRGAVERAGGDPTKIKFLAVPFPEMVTAARQGHVDAIAPVEPFVTSASEADLRIVSHTFPYAEDEQDEFVNSVYFTSTKYADEHADVVERFRRAMERSNAYAQDNDDKVRAQIPDYAGVDVELAGVIDLPDYPAERNDEAYRAEIELMARFGLIEDTPDLASLFTSD